MDAESWPALTWCEVDGPELRALAVAGGKAVAFTQKGYWREDANQDAALVRALDERRGVLAVADGAGGLPAGARAAGLAVGAIGSALDEREADGSVRSALLDAFEAANAAVMDLRLGAATTLAVVEIDGTEVRPYHVGDSSILVTGQRGLVKLQTVSHSPTGYAVEAGFLEPEEALTHAEGALVLNVVGNADMRIDLGSPFELAPYDTVLVGSDGVFDNLTVEEVVEIIRHGPLEKVAQALADKCRARMHDPEPGAPSKPDDLTFVLYRRGRSRRRSAGAGGGSEA